MGIPLRVLIIEDSENDTLLLMRELRQGGYEATYERVDSLVSMKAALDKQPWDIVLSDYSMPDFRGTDALLLLREWDPDTPFIYVSGTMGEDMAVAAMKAGANDYIIKGNLKRLIPAIRRELRDAEVRREGKQAEESLQARHRELEALQSISQVILTAPDFRTVLDAILDKTLSIGSFDLGVIRLTDPSSQILEPVASRGYRNPENIERHRASLRDPESGRIIVRAMTFKEPRIEENVRECEGLRTFKREGVESAIVIPVRAQEEVLGVLQLGTRSRRKFEPAEIRILVAIGSQLGIAVQKARLHEETKTSLARIRALHEIDLAITSTLDLRTVMEVLLEKLELFLPLPAATTVRLLNRGTGEVEPVACRNIDDKKWKALGGSPLGGRSYKVYATKTPLIISDLRESREEAGRLDFYLEQGLVSYAGVPLIAKGEALGVLSFYTREEHEFTEEEIEFLRTLAGQAAIAIHNAQLHEGIKKQAEELDRANKVKDAFLSVMSHELRTPLTVVTGYAGMIKDRLLGEINPQQEVALGKVLTRSGDLLAVVNNILLATVLETEKIKGERQKVVLGEFFIQLSSNYGTPVKKQLTLNWHCSSPSMVIHTDGAKLKLILQNLIDNAIKFTDKGSVMISATIRQEDFGELGRAATGERRPFDNLRVGLSPVEGQQETDASGLTPTDASRLPPHASEGWVEFRVADTGVGIPKEHLPVIFERFRQVDNSETRLYGGVGLGLYIVKKFTNMLGGTVEVESEPARGSTFTVILPYQRGQ